MKMGLCSIVFIVLLILKLVGVATISWWVVFSPLLIIAAFWLLLLPLFLIIGVLANMVADDYKNKRIK